MPTTFTPLDATGADREALIDFISSHEYPFHMNARPTRRQVIDNLDGGSYSGEDHAPFWIDVDGHGRVGVVVLEDLTEDTPMFDLRLATGHRGLGLGVRIVRDLTAHVFSTIPDARRFEGQTREDNIAMRKTFLRAGFLKEAHYREGWPVEGGVALASVAYAILRRDWESGRTTPFVWEDLSV